MKTSWALLSVLFAAAAISADARAERVRGVVVSSDPGSGSVAMIRDDSSAEPRQVIVNTDNSTVFKGAGAVADLAPGTQIEADIDPAGGSLSAPARQLEVLTTRQEMIQDIQTVRIDPGINETIFEQPETRGPRTMADYPASASGGAGTLGADGMVTQTANAPSGDGGS